jgi:aerobic carbon-monoxide dehydrogenase large subunit
MIRPSEGNLYRCTGYHNVVPAILEGAAVMRDEASGSRGIMAMSVIGAPVRRREDYRFITGRGTYTDDINRPRQLYAYILRSPHANARITGIDISAAASAPGVEAVYAGKDMAADGIGGLPCGWQMHSKDGSPMVEPLHPPLVADRVRYVGDQVAVVIAETLGQARDAAELIQVDYAEEPTAIDPVEALNPGAPQVWPEAPGNVCLCRNQGRVHQHGAG